MTRPDAKWRRSTLQCVRLSVLISGWSQQSYVVSASVCVVTIICSVCLSISISWFIVHFRCSSCSNVWAVAWTFNWRVDTRVIWESLIGSLTEEEGKPGTVYMLEHVGWLFRSLRTSLCCVTEYIVCYTPLKGPLSVRPKSQSTRTLTSAWSAWSTFIVSTWSWLAVYLSVT